jgi:hypothetical protein
VSRLSPAQRHKYWYDNLLRYAAKHFPRWQVRVLAAAVLAGAVGRMVTGIFGGRGLGSEFTRVLALAGDVLALGPAHARIGPGSENVCTEIKKRK